MQVVVVFAAVAAMTTGHNFGEETEMPTTADFTGADRPQGNEASRLQDELLRTTTGERLKPCPIIFALT
ncbi:hypothetical protein GALL_36610 [mine drainage metagenome]|uniref:Uncharacterized protein n=1 Tax=mine drainage metagenome TaxID=410659 RepID=A0A1J5T5D9_9ZZZZ